MFDYRDRSQREQKDIGSKLGTEQPGKNEDDDVYDQQPFHAGREVIVEEGSPIPGLCHGGSLTFRISETPSIPPLPHRSLWVFRSLPRGFGEAAFYEDAGSPL